MVFGTAEPKPFQFCRFLKPSQVRSAARRQRQRVRVRVRVRRGPAAQPEVLHSVDLALRVRAKAADDRRYLAGALAYHARRMETTSSGEGAGPKEGPRGGSKEQGTTPPLMRARRHTHAHTCARNTHATPPLLPSSARHCPSPPGRTSRVYTPPRNGQGSPRFTAHRELPVPSSPSSRLRKIVLKSISRRPTQKTTSQQAPNTPQSTPSAALRSLPLGGLRRRCRRWDCGSTRARGAARVAVPGVGRLPRTSVQMVGFAPRADVVVCDGRRWPSELPSVHSCKPRLTNTAPPTFPSHLTPSTFHLPPRPPLPPHPS